jgi:hypothetical protein
LCKTEEGKGEEKKGGSSSSIMTLQSIDYDEDYRIKHSFSLIPNWPRTKKPAYKEKGEYEQYFDKICYDEIKSDYNVGVMLGKPSYNLVSFDDDTYKETFLDMFPEYRDKTLTTKSGQKGGAILFRLSELPKFNYASIKKDGKQIEFFSRNRQIILPPSIHPDTGNQYEFKNNCEVLAITRQEFQEIFEKLKSEGWEISYSNDKKLTPLGILNKDVIVHEGENRSLFLLRQVDSWKVKNPEFDEKMLYDLAVNWNQTHCDPPYPDEKIRGIVKQGFEFGTEKNRERVQLEATAKPDLEIYDIALQLVETLDKKHALEELTQFNKSLESPYTDTKLKHFISMAEKQIKKNLDSEFKSNNSNDELNSQMKTFLIGRDLIKQKVRNQGDTEQIVIRVMKNQTPVWVDIFSSTVEQLLRVSIQEQFGTIYADSVYLAAMKNLHAHSLLDENIETRQIYKICAFENDCLYYNTNDQYGTIYKVSRDGITKIHDDDDTDNNEHPIFLKKQNIESDVNRDVLFDNPFAIKHLSALCRVQEHDRRVWESHLVCEFLNNIPIPIINHHGEQGSAKTTVSNAIKYIVDPEVENAASMPKSVDDLAVTMSKREISNFDNMDKFERPISDFLCRVVTGTTHPKRKLFTNGEEFNLILKEKIILNGISPDIDQPDLVERSIFYELPSIDKSERMTDDDFKEKIDGLRPYIVGQVLQTIQKAMLILDGVKEENRNKLPRMASFAVWGEAISRVLGNENNKFLNAYWDKLEESNLGLTEEYPIIKPILSHMTSLAEIEMTTSNFYDEIVPEDQRHGKTDMPEDVKAFGRQLKQIAPVLRAVDIEIESRIYNSRDGRFPRGNRIIKIKRMNQ